MFSREWNKLAQTTAFITRSVKATGLTPWELASFRQASKSTRKSLKCADDLYRDIALYIYEHGCEIKEGDGRIVTVFPKWFMGKIREMPGYILENAFYFLKNKTSVSQPRSDCLANNLTLTAKHHRIKYSSLSSSSGAG